MGIDTLIRTLRKHPHLPLLVRKLSLKVLESLWYGFPLQPGGEIYCLNEILSSLKELSLSPPIPYNSLVKVLQTIPTVTCMRLDFFYDKTFFGNQLENPK